MTNHFSQFKTLVNENKVHFFIVDGLDGVGKGTITEEIINFLSNKKQNVISIDYPQYNTFWGEILQQLLKRDDNRFTISERMAIYALNRLESVDYILKEAIQLPHCNIVFDRFSTSNILTIAYYYSKSILGNCSIENLESEMEKITNDIYSNLNTLVEIDSAFLELLCMNNAQVCVSHNDTSVSLSRLKSDLSRSNLDSYEEPKVQYIANYLYKIASKISTLNINIIEQNNKDANSLAQEIIDFYGYSVLETNEQKMLTIKLSKLNQYSLEVQSAMAKLLNKYPKLLGLTI